MSEQLNGDPWFISGCPVCVYAEHSPRPSEFCPNDGERLIRFDGSGKSWGRLAKARRVVRAVIDAVVDRA